MSAQPKTNWGKEAIFPNLIQAFTIHVKNKEFLLKVQVLNGVPILLLKVQENFKLEHKLNNSWSVNIVQSNENQEKPVIEKRLESTDRT